MASIPVAESERNLFNNDHGAGKGDKERSSKWRDNYSEIVWPGVEMERRGAKLCKRY